MRSKTRRHHRRHKHTRRRRQSGGAGHIYTIPLHSLYETIHNLQDELIELRSKCTNACIKKLCTGPDPVLCEQTKRFIKNKSVGEYATTLCHSQLLAELRGNSDRICPGNMDPKCACYQFSKKYKELEGIMFELNTFLSNYHAETPMKAYITKIREAGRSILAFMDNYKIIADLDKVSEELRTKTINEIMQTAEFKNGLKAAVSRAASPAPVGGAGASPASTMTLSFEPSQSPSSSASSSAPSPSSSPAPSASSKMSRLSAVKGVATRRLLGSSGNNEHPVNFNAL